MERNKVPTMACIVRETKAKENEKEVACNEFKELSSVLIFHPLAKFCICHMSRLESRAEI